MRVFTYYLYFLILSFVFPLKSKAQNYLNALTYRFDQSSINPALISPKARISVRASHSFIGTNIPMPILSSFLVAPFPHTIHSKVSIQACLRKLKLDLTVGRGFDFVSTQVYNDELPQPQRYLYDYRSLQRLIGLTGGLSIPIWSRNKTEVIGGFQFSYGHSSNHYLSRVLGFYPEIIGYHNVSFYVHLYSSSDPYLRAIRNNFNGGIGLAIRNPHFTVGIAYLDILKNTFPIVPFLTIHQLPYDVGNDVLKEITFPKRFTAYAEGHISLGQQFIVSPGVYFRSFSQKIQDHSDVTSLTDVNLDVRYKGWLRGGFGIWSLNGEQQLKNALVELSLGKRLQVGYSQIWGEVYKNKIHQGSIRYLVGALVETNR
ncbi:hypothetical protein [Larkinella rosea]|uniref:Type IX secretion system membrane protein PorP/SprF n=1 Tax=Larkinella rosea TaxID=2025312 RepID=A0A3P1C3L2_9BACT|nr:hypothetical protein [Larkinella rosea]RRB07859.1 hypothetical protein EHT25_08810 [Larkinella rosea]